MPRGGRRSTSFRPGQSGNPSGRPKRPATIEARKTFRDVADAARECTQDAIDTLFAIMKDPKAPAPARISAAQALLDRGYGKPAQAIAISEQADLSHISDEDTPSQSMPVRNARGSSDSAPVGPREGNDLGDYASQGSPCCFTTDLRSPPGAQV
jgi:hypothetical protein